MALWLSWGEACMEKAGGKALRVSMPTRLLPCELLLHRTASASRSPAIFQLLSKTFLAQAGTCSVLA